MARAKSIPTSFENAILRKVKLEGKDASGKRKYRFHIKVDRVEEGHGHSLWSFLLSEDKALLVANGEKEFPVGATLRVTGRRTANDPQTLKHAKVHSIAGVEARAWAERNRSTQIDPSILDAAEASVQEASELEAAMRLRAPATDPPLAFKGKQEAFEGAMFIVRRQMRKKDPHLSKDEILALRDALNILNDSAG